MGVKNGNVKDRLDVGNFMGVLGATRNTPTGVEFPGENMPSGNPVVSQGVTQAQIMADRGLAEQWWTSIKGQYEREKDAINSESRTADTPKPAVRREDQPAGESRGGAEAAKVYMPEPEEELQSTPSLETVLAARVARETALAERQQVALQELMHQHEETMEKLRKAEAALEAVLS